MKITTQLKIPSCWQCHVWANWMDQIGPDGCELPENFDKIVAHFRGKYEQMGWFKKRGAELRALFTTLPYKVDWTDPIPGIIREAISRARMECAFI